MPSSLALRCGFPAPRRFAIFRLVSVASPSLAATTPWLAVRAVSRRFGAVVALDQVSLDIAQGRFVTLLGPSGCGKTTLLRILAGLELPQAGSILLEGRDITRLPAQQRPTNTVFQSYALFPHLRVSANIAFGLRARRLPEVEIRQRVSEAAELLHLHELLGRYPHELSGGQKQRVALARALVNRPALLLLDEPMSALDAKLRTHLQVELRQLQQRLGATFLLVTHDQDEAMTVSDDLFVMNHGRIVQAGSPREVYEQPRNRFVAHFLGSANVIAGRRDEQDAHLLHTALGVLRVGQPLPWREGEVAIRPERLRAVAGAGSNCVAGAVTQRIYRGDHQDVELSTGALRWRTEPTQELSVGQTVALELPAEHLHPLENECG